MQENIQSALIFEDDADWDVSFKQQLVEFARGATYVQGERSPILDVQSPYGQAWDLLWLGHCGAKSIPAKDGRYYAIYDDITVVDDEHRRKDIRRADLSAPALQGEFTRVVHELHNPRCALAYALSLRGAQKLLHHYSVEANAAPWDRTIQTFCDEKKIEPDALCITVTPSLVEGYHPAGNTKKDSDRSEVSRATERKIGFTEKLVFPVKDGLTQWVDRAPGENIWHSKYANATLVPEVDMNTFKYPRGHGHFIQSTEFKIPADYYQLDSV